MDALSNAVSGLRAAQLQVDVAANNVANVNTPGFQPSVTEQESQAGGGVAAHVAAGQAPPNLPNVPAADQPSGTDLTTEMAALVTGPIAYAANGRVIDFSVQATRSLLDVLA
jgi:flagellar basal-body rod protein FlgC